MTSATDLRREILALGDAFLAEREKTPFVAGESYIPCSGAILDAGDLRQLLDASLDLWLTRGRRSAAFEAALAARFGLRQARLTVSGSAANLLAFAALTSWKLQDRRIAPGDLLYVPQHWIHMASAGEDFSFALTVGFRPISWADVLGALSTRHLFGVAPLSEPVPAWALADGRLSPQGRDRLAEVLKLLVDSPNLRQMMEYVDVKPRVAATNGSSGIAAVNQVRRLGAAAVIVNAPGVQEEYLRELSSTGTTVASPDWIGEGKIGPIREPSSVP